jgi:DNA-binding NtrC family response regulator
VVIRVAAGVAAVQDLAALIGQGGEGPQVPMKGLVRESADVVERRCLQAALRLTGNNRSAAARTLGISRQALYQKLERYGLDEV